MLWLLKEYLWHWNQYIGTTFDLDLIQHINAFKQQVKKYKESLKQLELSKILTSHKAKVQALDLKKNKAINDLFDNHLDNLNSVKDIDEFFKLLNTFQQNFKKELAKQDNNSDIYKKLNSFNKYVDSLKKLRSKEILEQHTKEFERFEQNFIVENNNQEKQIIIENHKKRLTTNIDIIVDPRCNALLQDLQKYESYFNEEDIFVLVYEPFLQKTKKHIESLNNLNT